VSTFSCQFPGKFVVEAPGTNPPGTADDDDWLCWGLLQGCSLLQGVSVGQGCLLLQGVTVGQGCLLLQGVSGTVVPTLENYM